MFYGISLPHFGELADARLLAEVAREAEEAGWDGFFIWDHIGWGLSGVPMVDPWVALTAAAMNTERIKLGPMVTPLPRRRPTKVARETVSLDRLSGGRFILGVGIGDGPNEWENLGDAYDARTRGAMLDEALEVLSKLWTGEAVNHEGPHYMVKESIFVPTPIQQPRIPVWVAGTWPTKTEIKGTAPFRRAARWDGVFPIARDLGWTDMLSPQHMKDIAALVREHRQSEEPFDLVLGGISTGDPTQDGDIVASYAEVGVTWWVENVIPHRYDGWDWIGPWPLAAMRDRIRLGPPKS